MSNPWELVAKGDSEEHPSLLNSVKYGAAFP
jgi:hypothetical protein